MNYTLFLPALITDLDR